MTAAVDVVVVTKSDREAAAMLRDGLGWCASMACICKAEDDCPFIQAFARHRHAAMLEGAWLMQASADECDVGEHATGDITSFLAGSVARQNAIRALDPATVLRNAAGGDA